ncbi:MAG: thiamine pyrophosphate-dependent enzyme [Eubacteriales bacterium]
MTTELSFARAAVRQLAAWGVKVIYGVTGNDILAFTDALAQEGSIRGSATFEEKFLPRVATIQLENMPWQINDIYLWDSLAGDVSYIINLLTEGLKGYTPDPTWSRCIASAKKQLTEIIAALNHLVKEDAVITIDEGAFNHWFDRDFQASNQRILLSSRWCSMGAGLPAAIAAQARYPERQVITLVGDGGLLMSLGELAVAVKYKLPITILVVNNRLYGLEKDKTLAAGLTPLGLRVQAPDFSRYAEACGAAGFRVEDSARLTEALRQALALPGPVLVDVVCADVRLPNLQ